MAKMVTFFNEYFTAMKKAVFLHHKPVEAAVSKSMGV